MTAAATPGIMLFVSGMLAAGYAVAALFFLRFWRESRDRLFAGFAAAFTLLFVHRLLLAVAVITAADATLAYVLRLIAFVILLATIYDKNRVH